jgi:hypothetical protein
MNCKVLSTVTLSQGKILLDTIQEEEDLSGGNGNETISAPTRNRIQSSSRYPATILPELHRRIY